MALFNSWPGFSVENDHEALNEASASPADSVAALPGTNSTPPRDEKAKALARLKRTFGELNDEALAVLASSLVDVKTLDPAAVDSLVRSLPSLDEDPAEDRALRTQVKKALNANIAKFNDEPERWVGLAALQEMQNRLGIQPAKDQPTRSGPQVREDLAKLAPQLKKDERDPQKWADDRFDELKKWIEEKKDEQEKDKLDPGKKALLEALEGAKEGDGLTYTPHRANRPEGSSSDSAREAEAGRRPSGEPSPRPDLSSKDPEKSKPKSDSSEDKKASTKRKESDSEDSLVDKKAGDSSARDQKASEEASAKRKKAIADLKAKTPTPSAPANPLARLGARNPLPAIQRRFGAAGPSVGYAGMPSGGAGYAATPLSPSNSQSSGLWDKAAEYFGFQSEPSAGIRTAKGRPGGYPMGGGGSDASEVSSGAEEISGGGEERSLAAWALSSAAVVLRSPAPKAASSDKNIGGSLPELQGALSRICLGDGAPGVGVCTRAQKSSANQVSNSVEQTG